jgi:hypothetical protein
MYSYRQFTPGKKSNSSKILYITQLNALNPNAEQLSCICIPDKYDKFTVGSDSPSTRISNNMRISQIIQANKGGSVQYGNFYLGQSLQLNYLGRAEGMPFGSGKPPTNNFR